jgi:hypothetical protein
MLIVLVAPDDLRLIDKSDYDGAVNLRPEGKRG